MQLAAWLWILCIVVWATGGIVAALCLPRGKTGWIFVWAYGGILVIFALGYVLPAILK